MDTPVKLVELFDSLAKRPQMYVGRVCFELMQSYLHGIEAGLSIAGTPTYSGDDYHFAAASRGWDQRGSEGIVRDFRKKGLTEAEMVQELIAVEAEAYRLGAARRGRVSP